MGLLLSYEPKWPEHIEHDSYDIVPEILRKVPYKVKKMDVFLRGILAIIGIYILINLCIWLYHKKLEHSQNQKVEENIEQIVPPPQEQPTQ